MPSARRASSGTSWAAGSTPGRSVPLSSFTIAQPGNSARSLDTALSRGRDLLLTPGVYDIDRTLEVKRANAVVLGLGMATLTSARGATVLSTADVPGIDLAGMTVDAGPTRARTLVQIGTGHPRRGASSAADPTALQDVFFRIGGPHAGRADTSLVVDADHVVLDDIWAWRADHGTGVGWTQNTAATGLVVNGSDVNATGLFVEHYQRFQVIWNGAHGSDVFFQSEMPYDVPSQSAWMSSPTTKGYAAVLVNRSAQGFAGYGMGTYSFFNQGIDIYADHAYQVQDPSARPPARPADDLPRRHQRQGRHPARRERHRRLVHGGQPGHAGDGHRLPVAGAGSRRQRKSDGANSPARSLPSISSSEWPVSSGIRQYTKIHAATLKAP